MSLVISAASEPSALARASPAISPGDPKPC